MLNPRFFVTAPLLIIACTSSAAQQGMQSERAARPSLAQTQAPGEAEFRAAAEQEFLTPSRFPIPDGHGPGFALSVDYPAQPPSEPQPWARINFRSEPERYLRTALAYLLEGNEEVDWDIRNNRVRRWYHAPWMHAGTNGREPIHGLTLERRSRAGELHQDQQRRVNNWAVGFYNPVGGYTLGRVWADRTRPDTRRVRFPIGTVSAKLLFTDATALEVPYLNGAKTWSAFIRPEGEVPRVAEMRLLQVDIAIRDRRAGATGWVFGTFMYNSALPGRTPWDRLQFVGLHWGNDPDRRLADVERRLIEGRINPEVARMFAALPRRWLGLWGRMNGPVDNPNTTCSACHARAMDLGYRQVVVPFEPDITSEDSLREYFRNRRPADPFFAGFRSLDYSLQLSDGVYNYRAWVARAFPQFREFIYGEGTVLRPFSQSLTGRSPASANTVNSEDRSPFVRGEPD